ncbi:MAG: transposase [archaeon]|nr:transposase [archaeon]
MPKKSKIQTPDWILKGGKQPKEEKKGKTFKVKKCPKCGGDKVSVVIGEVGLWECKKCKWKGKTPSEEELDEEEFMEYLDKIGEEVA